MQYYFSLDGTTQQGPVDAAGLKAAGATRETMVWAEGMGDWQPAGAVPELAALFPAVSYTPPVGPPPVPPSGPTHLPYKTPDVTPGTNGMAIASLVCGIIGVVTFCCFVPSVLAIVFGHNARTQIARGHGTGTGFATAGIWLGWLAIVFAVIGITFRFQHGHFYYNGQRFGY